jgi:hypothetical protein
MVNTIFSRAVNPLDRFSLINNHWAFKESFGGLCAFCYGQSRAAEAKNRNLTLLLPSFRHCIEYSPLNGGATKPEQTIGNGH